jgi:Flp pilus assembly protein TadG
MRLLREQDGSVLVEVALALPILATILIGAVDFGVLLEQQLRVQCAAATAAAYVTAPGENNDLAGAQQAALQSISGLNGAQASAQRYWSCAPGGSHVSSSSLCANSRTPMQWVQVDVYASGDLLMSFPGFTSNNTLHASATQRVQWMPS